MAVMCDKETKEAVPVTAFLNADRLAKDIARINDAARTSRWMNVMGVSLALLHNYNPFKSPTHFKLTDLIAKFDKCFGMTPKAQKGGYGKVTGDRTMEDITKRRNDRWNFLFVAGMWFQDLFNYDFRRTEQCIIPYATQEGEISFCAYNTGVGWRNIIEKMHMTATLTKWYEEHGRHEIIAGGKAVNLQSYEHSLRIDAEDAARVRELEHDIPQTAAEEDRIRRKKAFEEAAKVRRIYEELVLKKSTEPVVQIGSMQQILSAVPGVTVKPVQIAPANGNGNGHSNGDGHANGNGTAKVETTEAEAAVAGD